MTLLQKEATERSGFPVYGSSGCLCHTIAKYSTLIIPPPSPGPFLGPPRLTTRRTRVQHRERVSLMDPSKIPGRLTPFGETVTSRNGVCGVLHSLNLFTNCCTCTWRLQPSTGFLWLNEEWPRGSHMADCLRLTGKSLISLIVGKPHLGSSLTPVLIVCITLQN